VYGVADRPGSSPDDRSKALDCNKTKILRLSCSKDEMMYGDAGDRAH